MQTHLLTDFAIRGRAKDVMAALEKRAGAAIAVVCAVAISAMVASCGGSGGGGDGAGAGVSAQAVSGVAATGSPLAGQVTLRDSSAVRKDKVTDTGSDGSFTIDVAGMTGPFILKATGTADGVSRTMFSFADKPGTANINPLSTVALANAAGVDDPADVFDKSDSAMLEKVKSGMRASVATLQLKLKPLLDEFSAGNANPVDDDFTANHEGLDAVFDNVKVVIANGTLTITNVDTGAVLFTAQLKDIEHGRFTDKDDDVPKHGRPRPAAPTGVTAVGGPGAGQVTVSWDPVPNATSYDLFFTPKPKAEDEEDRDDGDAKQRIRNVTSPFIVTGLDQATTYFFVVRARINGRKGPLSAVVSASPSGTTSTSTTTTTSTTGATTSTTAGVTSTTAGTTTSTTAGATTTTTVLPPPTTTTTTTTTTPTTTTTTASTTSTTLAINGAALYAANCQSCHNALANSEKRGVSATAITNAIAANRGGMGSISLTQPQIAAIAAALFP